MMNHGTNFFASMVLSTVITILLFIRFPDITAVIAYFYLIPTLFVLLELIRVIRKRPYLGVSLLVSVIINYTITKVFTEDCEGCLVAFIAGFPLPMKVADYDAFTYFLPPLILNHIFWTLVIYFIFFVLDLIVKRFK